MNRTLSTRLSEGVTFLKSLSWTEVLSFSLHNYMTGCPVFSGDCLPCFSSFHDSPNLCFPKILVISAITQGDLSPVLYDYPR